MSWIHRAWPVAFLALGLTTACPAEDTEDDTAAETVAATSMDDATATSPAATADETAAADGSAALGCAAGIMGDATDGASNPLMQTWGAPCQTNEDCIALIGDPAAVCDFTAVVYELPGGYCTKPCTLPDDTTRAVLDDPQCAADGGVACIGVLGTFERCAIPCTDDDQCNREGYLCRQLPLISAPEDPSFCLMPDCCQDTCEE